MKRDPAEYENRVVRPHFRADIEGLRAIAIILVVGYHARIPGFSGGYVGVDVFFVLSGYLITWLLVHEMEETGKIDLWRFYARRARRLLPALGVVLLIVVLLTAILYAPFEQQRLANAAASTSLYLSNVYFARMALDYLSPDIETDPFLHTWSLAVEEQFYLGWPIFVGLALGAAGWRPRSFSRRRLLVLMGIVALCSFLLCLYLTDVRQPWAFFLSPARAWEFALGALGLLLPKQNALVSWLRESTRRFLGRSGRQGVERGGSLAGWLGMTGLLVSSLVFDQNTAFPGTMALLPAVSTVFVLRAGSAKGETALSKALSLRPLQEIGRLSYSWYLWHWPVLVLAAAVGTVTFGSRVGLLLLSLAIAEMSYRLVEAPIRQNRWLAHSSNRSLAMGLCITLVAAGSSLAWRQMSIGWQHLPSQLSLTQARDELPAVYASGCHADFDSVTLNISRCTSGTASASLTMVLVGDSHAAQWYPALNEIATTKQWRLVSLTKSDCPAVYVPKVSATLGREYSECTAWWDEVLRWVEMTHPDLVVVASFYGQQFSNAEWLTGTDRILQRLSAASKRVAVLKDTPHAGYDVPICYARAAWRLPIFPLTCEPTMRERGHRLKSSEC